MRILMLLVLVLIAGCSKATVRQPVEDDPRDTRSEAQKLEDRLGV